MSQVLIRQALENRTKSLDPAFYIIPENGTIAPPASATTPYFKTFFMPVEPDNTIAGQKVFFEKGIYQISLYYPMGAGALAAAQKAEALRAHFKRGTSLVQGGLTTTITHTPRISQGREDGGRWHLPITIRWQAQVEVA